MGSQITLITPKTPRTPGTPSSIKNGLGPGRDQSTPLDLKTPPRPNLIEDYGVSTIKKVLGYGEAEVTPRQSLRLREVDESELDLHPEAGLSLGPSFELSDWTKTNSTEMRTLVEDRTVVMASQGEGEGGEGTTENMSLSVEEGGYLMKYAILTYVCL